MRDIHKTRGFVHLQREREREHDLVNCFFDRNLFFYQTEQTIETKNAKPNTTII